jgi:hypothetical protein
MFCVNKFMFLHHLQFNHFINEFDIVLCANGICTLPNIIITNPTQLDLIFWIGSSCEVIATMVA